MRKFLVVALGSALALLGFAGAANASATIDLIWVDSGTAMIGDPDTSVEVGESQSITLNVIVTAGAAGVESLSVSVDYSAAIGKLGVLGASAIFGGSVFPLSFFAPVDTGSRVNTITVASLPPFVGTGLASGLSELIGTVTFLKAPGVLNGDFEIRVDTNTEGDGIVAFGGTEVFGSTFNSAFLINVPEPGALSLLVLGLGGLGLVGRGRRS